MNFRRRKRAMHHAEAHAEDGDAPQILLHDQVPQGVPELIDSPEPLRNLIDHLRQQESFAYDTEFIGEETFHPHICLIQVATRERVALIDPFAVADLSDLWRVVCDPAHVTIVHAGGQDVDAAQRAAGRPAERIFDTQIAGAFVGLPWPTSLGSLVEALTAHRLLKGHTFTEWDARPLSKSQLGYAADDVRYLPLAYSRLQEQLQQNSRWDWVLAECQQAINDAATFDPMGQVKRACKGLTLRPRTMTILRELVLLRHALARESDAPPRTVIPDVPLLEVARAKPTTNAELAGIRGMPRPVAEQFGARIVATIQAARNLPLDHDNLWSPAAESGEDRMRIDALWSLVTMRCIAQGLAAPIVLTRAQLATWYLDRRKDHSLMLFPESDWRHNAVGRWLGEFVGGGLELAVRWSEQGPRISA
ncbi:MAG: hypothetical protein EXS00_03110 [Phycisphaerales bacterium]|nr:hypothetical protein [Phycisphaerales bacterium]